MINLRRMASLLTRLILIALCTGSAHADPVNMRCGDPATLVSTIQGAGDSSPLIPKGKGESKDVVVEAVVTANTPERLRGFFIQEEITDEDNNPNTSEGLFIYGPHPELIPGNRVRVRGTVRETHDLTQLVAQKVIVCDSDTKALDKVRPAIPKKGLVLQEMEHLEGMLVSFKGDSFKGDGFKGDGFKGKAPKRSSTLTVSRNYSYDFESGRSSMDVSLNGPLFKPTQLFPPNSPKTIAQAKANNKNRLTLITDERKQVDGRISYYPVFDPDDHYIRVGDTIRELTGVVTFRYGRYQLLPTKTLDAGAFQHSFSPRKDFPKPHISGTVRVGSFNVMNYFNTLEPGHKPNPTGTNRGAQSKKEFVLQRDKIAETIARMNADILGLMEIENNGFGKGSAIADLLDAINSRLPAREQYAAITTSNSAPIGTDAITVVLIYKTACVTPVGKLHIITMPAQHFALKNSKGESISVTRSTRPTITQNFRDIFSKQTISIAVNHFKSKHSMCDEDYRRYTDSRGRVPLDGLRIRPDSPMTPGYVDNLQGNCNQLRVAAAHHLGQTITQLNENLSSNILLIGDFNAYGQEDPLRALTSDFNLVNLATAGESKKSHIRQNYSFAYHGELGALDHAIANKSLARQLVHFEEWHINSVENSLFEYPDKFSGNLPKDSEPFSSSDHDPLIVDFDLTL